MKDEKGKFANSQNRIAGQNSTIVPARTPGPLGHNDASEPRLVGKSRVDYVAKAFTLSCGSYVLDEARKLLPESWEGLTKALLPEIFNQLKLVALSAGVGMVLGGIAGTFAFPGVGTGLGMLVGAKLGGSVAFLFINFYGLIEIGKIVPGLLAKVEEALAPAISSGIKTAWNSAGDHKQIDLAARQLAPGLAIILAFLLAAAFILAIKKGYPSLQQSRLIKNPGVNKWLAKIPKRLRVDEAAWESGWNSDVLRRLGQLSQNQKIVRIYRARKRGAVKYEGKPGYRSKPMDVQLKSQAAGPYEGLVMLPEDINLLPSDSATKVRGLLDKGYKLERTNQNDGLMYLIDPKGNKIYSDIDPMGSYRQVESGGFVRTVDDPREMNAKLGQKIWDDPDMERASGFGAQDHYWVRTQQKEHPWDPDYEMRADPAVKEKLKGKFSDETIMRMGGQVRKMARTPDPSEKFLVATPDGNFYVMDVPQLEDFYKVMRVWWPYGN